MAALLWVIGLGRETVWGFREGLISGDFMKSLQSWEGDGKWFNLLGSLCSDSRCWKHTCIFPGALSPTTLGTVFVLLSRAVSPSCADSQTLPAHRGENGDPEMWDLAPSTAVIHSASILLLQRRPGLGIRLEQLPRAQFTYHMEWRLRVLLVPGRDSDSPCQEKKLEIPDTCAEWVSVGLHFQSQRRGEESRAMTFPAP